MSQWCVALIEIAGVLLAHLTTNALVRAEGARSGWATRTYFTDKRVREAFAWNSDSPPCFWASPESTFPASVVCRRYEGTGAPLDARSAHYFRTHVFVPLSHTPLAFSQSPALVYFEKSSELCDGLAEGEPGGSADAPDPLEAPGALLVPLLEAAPAPGPPDPCRGLFGLVLPGAPLLTCAAARAGARAMIPTKSVNISFCM
jgi:hypothetical protein